MLEKNPLLSIAIPTHSVKGNDFFFKRLLDSLWGQSCQNFEIIVSDNSKDNVIRDICDLYKTGINYDWNPKMGMAHNTNHAIKRSKGELIKILYLDDFLCHAKVLEGIVNNFKGHWLICGSDNNPTPYWTDDILMGNNRLGSPSALTIKNDSPLLFDERLSWMLDVVYYNQLHKRYGEPTIMAGKHIGIGVGEHQTTYTMSDRKKQEEGKYVMKKYNK